MYRASAALLANGKVLIAGGVDSARTRSVATAVLYDPATNTFATTGSLNTSRCDFTATTLPNGKVLITGGLTTDGCGPNCFNRTASTELYDPAIGTFTPAIGTLSGARDDHSATLLPNGMVLIAGGVGTAGWQLFSTELFDPGSETFSDSGVLNHARTDHTATLLPSGRVFFAGGEPDFASTELYDPDQGSAAATGPLSTGREKHTATLLPNGKILITGGTSGAGNALASCELFDPATATFTATGDLGTAHHSHTATLLANGKVLIVGGFGPNTISTAELYDPASGLFTPTGSLGITEHTSTLLPDGRVLVRGGTTASTYDPAQGSFSATGSVVVDRKQHTATLLANGKVLIAGGYGPPYYQRLTSAELYDPATGTFTATTGVMGRADNHRATLLANGKVLITHTNTSAELFDPLSRTFAPTGPMTTSHSERFSATALGNGKVLIAGGTNGPSSLASAELYDPTSGTFAATGSLADARENHTATLLLNGKVLLAGGDDGGALATADLYDPGQGIADARRPVVSGAPSTQLQPATMSLTGTLFTGDSEGSSGATGGSPANVPLLHLHRVDNDQRLVVRGTSWTDSSFTSMPITGLPAGHYRVSLVTNGIPSLQALVSFGDAGPRPEMTISDVTVTEGNSGTVVATFTVSLSAAGAPMTVSYATSDGTATTADYVAASGTLEFPMGTTSRTLTVSVMGDTAWEPNETFFVDLSDATGATITDAQGQATINNDDPVLPPTNVVATAASATSVLVTWTPAAGAESYRVYRGERSGGAIVYSLVGAPVAPPFTDEGAAAATSYYYKVRSFSGTETADSPIDLATTVIFTDPSLSAGTTVKLAHFAELLTAVNAVRGLAGFGPIAFTAPTPAVGVTVRRQHVFDLRSGLNQARSALGLSLPTYTDPSLTAGVTPIRSAHITNLRDAVK